MKYVSILGFAIVVVTLTMTGCNKTGNDAKEKVYDVKSKVVAIEADKKRVKLDHEEIPGYMKAMTMFFTVEDAKMLDGLKDGDDVHGKLRVKDGTSVLIELKK